MGFEGETKRAVVVHHMLRQRHDGKGDARFVAGLGRVGMIEQRQRNVLRQAAHLPQGLAAVEPERAEGIGACELLEAGAPDAAAPPQIAHIAIGAPPSRMGDDALRVRLAQAVDLTKPKTQRTGTVTSWLERAVPGAVIDVGLARLDPMLAGAPHDLRRRVEAHGLGIEQGAGERRRVMAFEPGRDIDEMGEARGVAFGKAVLAEALDLVEAALGEIGRIAARGHAADHLVLQRADGAAAAERGHGAAQLVGLGTGEFRRHHGEPHGLLLEQRHAHGLAEDLMQLVGGPMGSGPARGSRPARRRSGGADKDAPCRPGSGPGGRWRPR